MAPCMHTKDRGRFLGGFCEHPNMKWHTPLLPSFVYTLFFRPSLYRYLRVKLQCFRIMLSLQMQWAV